MRETRDVSSCNNATKYLVARLGFAAASPICALVLTHLFWRFLDQTPFLLGFGSAVLSSWVGGRTGGFLAVAVGAILYALFPPPLPEAGFGPHLVGFVVLSSACSWLVARRYEIEAALRSSESRLAEAQQLAQIGNWEWDVRNHSESWSDQVYRIFGIELNSVTPSFEAFSRFLHPEDREMVDSVVARAFADHQPFQCDNRIIRPDGSVRTLHVQGRVVLNERGQVARFIGTAQDITDRKAAEETVRRSERRLQTIIDAEPACVTLVSLDGTLLDMNHAGLKMVGAESLGQLEGRPVIGLVHPDDRDRYLQMHGAVTVGSPGRLEFRIVGVNSTEHWVDSHAVPFDISTDKGDTRRAVLSVSSDITERVRAQRALGDAEERMRFALEASRLGIWETNFKTGVSWWSETCELLHGLERGTFGKSYPAFIDCVHPADREAVHKTIDEAVGEHRNAELEYRTLWPDGTEHRILSSGHFFHDDAGAPLRGVGISIDVTEKRSLEAQLRQSQKMEAIGRLAGGIAHDFNNLLTAIIGYSELMRDRVRDRPDLAGDLEEIWKAGQRAGNLTRQLLTFSRKQMLRPVRINLNDAVAQIEKMLGRVLGEDIELRAIAGESLEPIKADLGQIEQVLMNLAINARDAMPRGGTLTIETANAHLPPELRSPETLKTAYVSLSVTDIGTGMSPEVHARMFEPFFTTKGPEKGTGLGLSTVYGIVTQGGGHITVTSELGRGTTVTLFFPVNDGPVDVRIEAPPPITSLTGTETILLVEDDTGVRELVRKTLQVFGYTILEARDVNDAVAIALTESQIDMLLSDIIMPELNGPDLAQRLTAKRPDMKVLYMSGYANLTVDFTKMNVNTSFLQKPFTPAILVRKVRECLNVAAQTQRTGTLSHG